MWNNIQFAPTSLAIYSLDQEKEPYQKDMDVGAICVQNTTI